MKKSKITKVLTISSIVLVLASVGISNTLLTGVTSKLKNNIANSNINLTVSNSNTTNLNANKSGLMLVNKTNPVNADFTPSDLVTATVPANKTMQINKTVNEKLIKMFDAAERDGHKLILVSGYRDFNYQKQLFDEGILRDGLSYTEKYVAKPGESEHQTGLAADIVSTKDSDLSDNFEKAPGGKWLAKNCYKFGFILRYPKGKENITKYNFEPWHFRYVGEALAKELTDSGLTLEEYVEKTSK